MPHNRILDSRTRLACLGVLSVAHTLAHGSFVAVLLLVTVVLAQADMSVQPYGDQIINGDNSQVLPSGGIVDDSKHGVKIDAKYIEFKAGEYVRAKTATIITKNGNSR